MTNFRQSKKTIMNKYLSIIIKILITLIAVYSGILVLEIISISQGYGYFYNKINQYFNLKMEFITAISIILTVIFLAYVTPSIKRYFSLKSNSNSKIKALWIVGGFFATMFTVFGFANRNNNFGIGKKPEACAILLNGQYVSTNCNRLNDVDAIYGLPVIEVTSEMIIFKDFKEIKVTEKTHFFNPMNKQPLVYYGQNVNEEYNFFNMLGNHPQTGEKLIPVSKEFLKKYFLSINKKPEIEFKQDSIGNNSQPVLPEKTKIIRPIKKPYVNLDTSIINSPNNVNTMVFITENFISNNNHLSALIAKKALPNDRVNYLLFSDIDKIKYKRLYSGDFSTLNLAEYIDRLVIGNYAFKCETSLSNKRLITCTIDLTINFFNISNGKLEKSMIKTQKGVGLTESDAKNNAFERIQL